MIPHHYLISVLLVDISLQQSRLLQNRPSPRPTIHRRRRTGSDHHSVSPGRLSFEEFRRLACGFVERSDLNNLGQGCFTQMRIQDFLQQLAIVAIDDEGFRDPKVLLGAEVAVLGQTSHVAGKKVEILGGLLSPRIEAFDARHADVNLVAE